MHDLARGLAAHDGDVCVIGAGSSGLAALRVLTARGFHVTGYEQGSQVGGNWRYDNDGGSAAYASLRCNVSRRRMAYPSFPMPRAFGDYPHHTAMAAYFDAYAERFALRPLIRFATRVESVEPEPRAGWRVVLAGGHVARHAAVVVANGHHWRPRWPELPGVPSARVLHARDYRRPEAFTGERVLVVGAGQSAAEIACEVARVAARVVISVRHPAHVLPRYVLGSPLDTLDVGLVHRLPWRLLNATLRIGVRAGGGGVGWLGDRAPTHRILEHVPVVSSEIAATVRSGAITVRPAIERIDGARVRFVDASTEAFDAIVCATGYTVSLPFLSPALVAARGTAVPLYRRIVAPGAPGLYFIGLVDAPAGLLPIVERQAEWLADVLSGALALPSPAAMAAAAVRAEPRSRQRFPGEPPGSIRCDPHAYVRVLAGDRRRARLRRALAWWRGRPGKRPRLVARASS